MKTLVLSMLFATAMFAASITETGVNGVSENNVYVSPYFLSIDGATPIEVWCVDYLDQVTIGETWDATIESQFVGAPVLLFG